MASILPIELPSHTRPPSQIHGYLSIDSQGGTSLLDIKSMPKSSEPFRGIKPRVKEARNAVAGSGLTIVAESLLGFAVVGPAAA